MRAAACLLLLLGGCGALENPGAGDGTLSLVVMSFNIWGAGGNRGRPIDETVAVIRKAEADIVGLQETRAEGDPCDASCSPAGPSAATEIAAALGYYVYEQTQENDALWANAILSRFPIREATPNDLGVSIDASGREVFIFNVHFTDFPYQPYQLLGIAYADAPLLETEAQAIAAANAARGSAVDLLVGELGIADEADAVFITGDFNEPSFRDWTARATEAGLHPVPVHYPATARIEAAGFRDAYRVVHADEVARPGLTWTPLGDPNDPGDHHDRIDYVFVRGSSVRIGDAAVIGESPENADIVMTPWPSDHRAVVATVRFEPAGHR